MTWIFGYRLSEYPGRIVVFFKLVAKRSGHQSHSGVLIFSGDLSFPARNAVEIKFHKEPDRQIVPVHKEQGRQLGLNLNLPAARAALRPTVQPGEGIQ